MALSPCPECKERISHQAQSCPKCGFPLEAGWGDKKVPKKKSVFRKITSLFFKLVLGVVMIVFLLIAVIAFFSSPSGKTGTTIALPSKESEITVSASEYGKDWGFTVDRLTVKCHPWTYPNGTVRPHVLIEANGQMYGLNGAAMGSGNYRNAREIMIRDKNGLFMAKGPGEVIERGLRLCDR